MVCHFSSALDLRDLELCWVLDIKVLWVDVSVRGAQFFFQPHIRPAAIPCLSQPSRVDMAGVFSHLALVHLLLLPSIDFDLQSFSKTVSGPALS